MKLAVSFLFLMAVVATAAEMSATGMNEILGVALFPESGMVWDEEADDVAKRLGLEKESATAIDESFRLYPKEDMKIFGLRPYSIAMSGQDGKPVVLNMVFANKGDSVGYFAPSAPGRLAPRVPSSALRGYRKAIKEDAAAIEEALTGVLGEPKPQKVGTGAKMQERSLRWDWNGHAILLVSMRDEYVAVRIVSAEDLDAPEGKTRVSMRDMKALLAERVERRENGDVVLRDLPMTDQGPKGFCVPATMERVLRYFGIPADMYLLAMAGNTQPGGGTTVRDILWAVNDPVRRAGRRITQESGMPDMQRISKWVESGLPVIWAINTSDTIDKRINEHTVARKNTSDWGEWKVSLKPARKNARALAKGAVSGHVCLIIGFNKETGELALSDSWGPNYTERWITQEEANAISQGSMAVLSW